MKQHKKLLLILAIVVVTVVIVVIVRQIGYSSEGKVNSAQAPDYPTVLPTNKTIANLGGWQRVSPTESDPVFAYSDNIEGIPITVSQQPLPTSLKDDTARKVEELAKSYSATTRLSTKSTQAYMGSSAKGPQSTIFVKNNLLILIKSQSKISESAWTSYVDSLDTPIDPHVSY